MTLTEAAHWTKRLIWFALAGMILFVVLVVVLINRSRPQQIPQYMFPDFACTPTREEFIPHIEELQEHLTEEAVEYTLESGADAFTLETQTGRIAQIPEVINVYRYDNPGQLLTVQDDAKDLADALRFEPEEMQRVGTTTYRWADAFGRTLTVQARNFVFELKTDLTRSAVRPITAEVPAEEQARNFARDLLSGQDLLTSDYLRGSPETMDITIQPDGTFRQAKYKQEADLVRVDFFREASMITIPSNVAGAEDARVMLERQGHRATTDEARTPQGRVNLYKFNTPVINRDIYKSNISVYVGRADFQDRGRPTNRVYDIDYRNWILEPEHCGTYKLVNPAQVLTYVQNQEASLMYLNESDGDKVLQDGTKNVRNFTIKDINVVYYDAPHEQEFLQPVYIISGEATFTTGVIGEFLFYYPAIDYEFMRTAQIGEEGEEGLE